MPKDVIEASADAFGSALVDLYPALTRYALVLTQSRDEAEDLVQDTFVKAIRGRRTFRSGSDLRAWAFTIMHHSFASGYQRKKRRTALARVVYPFSLEKHGVEASQERVVEIREVLNSLEDLSSEAQEIFRLVVLDAREYEETADLLGIPVGTVRSSLSRTREYLRKQSARDSTA